MSAILPRCDYSKHVWVLENPTPGQRERDSTANWHIPLRNGTLLTDPVNAVLLSELQAFVRSALEESRRRDKDGARDRLWKTAVDV